MHEAIVAEAQGECQDMILSKAEVDTRQFPEAANRKTRAGKKRKRQSKFDYHETSAQPLPATAGIRPTALFQSLHWIPPRTLPGGSTATQYAGDQRCCHAEKQHRQTHAHVSLGGYRKRRQEDY